MPRHAALNQLRSVIQHNRALLWAGSDRLRGNALTIYELLDHSSVADVVEIPKEACGTWYRSHVCAELKSIVYAKSPGWGYFLSIVFEDQVLEHDISDPVPVACE